MEACILESNKYIISRSYVVYDTLGRDSDRSLYRSELSDISILLAIF